MRQRLLLCTDMDRTLLPNGHAPETPGVRETFSSFIATHSVQLAYVTGRHLALVLDAIEEYDLPVPDFVITDVGTRIYQHRDKQWVEDIAWSNDIAKDWNGKTHAELKSLLSDIEGLQLQAEEKQNQHKLSYDVALELEVDAILAEIQTRLNALGVMASLVWSIDEITNIGLLDVLPRNATKLHAVEFLSEKLGVPLNQVIYAGDSGNDLQVMASEVPSVLVANSHDEVKVLADQQASEQGNRQALYLAQGVGLETNGNYAGGILEGVWHFMPQLRCELEALLKEE